MTPQFPSSRRREPPADGPIGLLLVGHGSTRNPHSRRPTERLAALLDGAGEILAARPAFLKEPPDIAAGLADLAALGARDIRVVPMFVGEGYFTRRVIPAALAAAQGPGRLTQTAAVGAHPRLDDIIRRRTADALRRAGAAPEEAALLLVGHGSTKRREPLNRGQEMAAQLRLGSGCRDVLACFLEQPPYVSDWTAQTDAPVVIVLPLLIAEGLHGSQDLPPRFGLRPTDVTEDAPPLIGPRYYAGRQIWYWRGIGSDPEIVSIIRDLAVPSA
jgi:sirohydrochlorin cobaltochelatase